jgi:hypothetical protein
MSLALSTEQPQSKEELLRAELEQLGERLADLVNAFASHHPNFTLTELSCDYVVYGDRRGVEYLVCLDLRL